MFDRGLNIKVIDFGLATSILGELLNGLSYTRAGSQPFWSPEIKIAEYPCGYIPAKADIYALGITYFVMKFRFYPQTNQFHKESFWYYTHISSFTQIDIILIDLLRNMLIINPLYRITIAQVLNHPWLA